MVRNVLVNNFHSTHAQVPQSPNNQGWRHRIKDITSVHSILIIGRTVSLLLTPVILTWENSSALSNTSVLEACGPFRIEQVLWPTALLHFSVLKPQKCHYSPKGVLLWLLRLWSLHKQKLLIRDCQICALFLVPSSHLPNPGWLDTVTIFYSV